MKPITFRSTIQQLGKTFYQVSFSSYLKEQHKLDYIADVDDGTISKKDDHQSILSLLLQESFIMYVKLLCKRMSIDLVRFMDEMNLETMNRSCLSWLVNDEELKRMLKEFARKLEVLQHDNIAFEELYTQIMVEIKSGELNNKDTFKDFRDFKLKMKKGLIKFDEIRKGHNELEKMLDVYETDIFDELAMKRIDIEEIKEDLHDLLEALDRKQELVHAKYIADEIKEQRSTIPEEPDENPHLHFSTQKDMLLGGVWPLVIDAQQLTSLINAEISVLAVNAPTAEPQEVVESAIGKAIFHMLNDSEDMSENKAEAHYLDVYDDKDSGVRILYESEEICSIDKYALKELADEVEESTGGSEMLKEYIVRLQNTFHNSLSELSTQSDTQHSSESDGGDGGRNQVKTRRKRFYPKYRTRYKGETWADESDQEGDCSDSNSPYNKARRNRRKLIVYPSTRYLTRQLSESSGYSGSDLASLTDHHSVDSSNSNIIL